MRGQRTHGVAAAYAHCTHVRVSQCWCWLKRDDRKLNSFCHRTPFTLLKWPIARERPSGKYLANDEHPEMSMTKVGWRFRPKSSALTRSSTRFHSLFAAAIYNHIHVSDKRVVTSHLHTFNAMLKWKFSVAVVHFFSVVGFWRWIFFGPDCLFRIQHIPSGPILQRNTCTHISSECPFYLLLKMLFSTSSFYNFRFLPSTDSPFCCFHSNFCRSLSIRGASSLLRWVQCTVHRTLALARARLSCVFLFRFHDYSKSSQYIPFHFR